MVEITEYNGMSIPEGTYAIDWDGNVYSLPRVIALGKKGQRKIPLRKMKLKLGKDGYYQIQLQVNGKSKFVRVHRLIADNFLSTTKTDINNHVNHIDGNKLNNKVSNLEWVSNGDNIKHAYESGLMEKSKTTQFKKGHIPWNKRC